MAHVPANVTQVLAQIQAGDAGASSQLLPLVYDELRKLAAVRLAQEKPGQTLQATALVHEAYIRLVGGNGADSNWQNRGHFFAAAAESMRRILVDQARSKKSERRGSGKALLELDENALPIPRDDSDRILAIHEALDQLEAESPRKAQLVKLRFFAGMTLEEAASVLDVAVPTAKRDWAAARVWLYRHLAEI